MGQPTRRHASDLDVDLLWVNRARRLPTRSVATLMALVMVMTLTDQPAFAQPEPEWEPPAPAETEGVQVSAVDPPAQPDFAAADAVVSGGELTVQWPQAGTRSVVLPADSVERGGVAGADGAPQPGRGGRVTAEKLPVRVGAAPLTAEQAELGQPGLEAARAQMPRQVTVQVADQAVARVMGIGGLLVSVARDDEQPVDTSVTVEVDYSQFRYAFGGGWASRLQVSMLGKCGGHPAYGALGAGGLCGQVTPLPTANDLDDGMLAAQVPLAGDGGFTTLAISAGPSGDNGDYTATKLSPASTWQVSAQTGAFAWSYPLRAVPGVGGPEPNLAVSYSSQAVDGLTANTNTQGSWIGDGWELWPGYIERVYKPCLSDMDPVGGQEPNNPYETGDQCWFNDNATMSLNGHAGELVNNGDGSYRLTNDDGTRIELLSDTGLGNGDNNGEYWKVTTTDGAQYFFGRHRRPAYPTDTAVTNSTWTVPVYGNHPGEPCHQAGDFSGSRCTQAWRWNLDYVVDAHGNSMTLSYRPETGAYGREADPDKRTTYHRGGYLERIEYGTRQGSEHEAQAPAQVVFDVADRCLPGTTCDKDTPGDWPDTPWDQYCDSAPCTDQLAPTFWTGKRLETIRTQVWRGSSYADVESWTLRHDWLDAGASDGEGIPMWLSGITRTGHVTQAGGAEVSEPEIAFDPGSTPLANRVDGPLDGKTKLNRWRVKDITTESGALVGVIYSGVECTRDTVPQPHQNTMRCFPQWYGNGSSEPELDWFHKYLVEAVIVEDLTGASPRMETHWDYLDDPAWHYTDSELVDEDKRTWAQWRGYSKVRMRQGLESGTQSVTELLYLRGMHGDRAGPSGGSRSVQITDSQGVSIDDHEAHAGFLRESTTFNGLGGQWTTGEINTPWREGPTAEAGPLTAWMSDTEAVRTRTALEDGTTRWTKQVTTFDSTYGMPTQVDDLGNESTSADDRCTRYEYARNTSIWMVDRVASTETVGVNCGTTAQDPDDVLTHTRTFYDDPDTYGATPTRGLPVKTQQVDSWSGTTPVWVTTQRAGFDVHGRVVEVYDALGNRTQTSYTPAVGGPVTATLATNQLGHTVASVMEPGWQLPVRNTDANGRITELAYDGLGRLAQVWLPGRDRQTQSGNVQFEYLVRTNAPSAVTTRELMPDGSNYATSISLLDGQLRERQTQQQAPGGGRTITDTVYDSRGLVEWESKPYYDTSNNPPDTVLVGPAGQPEIPGVIEYRYDGAERVTDQILKAYGLESWRTSYAYGGDRTHTTPPAGGTATTTITDARGRTVALRQYHGPTPTGSYDETTYTHTLRDELSTVTDHAGNAWSFTYDQRGRQVQVVDPDKGTTTTTYDAAGQESTVTDARGVTLGYTYDALGRRTSVRDGSTTGPKRAEWVFDTLPGGIGELTRSIRYQDGQQYVQEVLGYDLAGQPTGTRVAIPDAETGLDGTYDTTMTYKPDGSVYTVTMPAVGDLPQEKLVFAYNDVGDQTEIVSAHSIYVYQATYNKLGQLTQRVLGNFGQRTSVTYQFDEPTGRLVNTSAVPELQPEVMDLAYEYDAAGNLTRIADSPGSSSSNDTQCYAYDYLRRLTEAWTPASTAWWNCRATRRVDQLGGQGPYWHSFTYDSTGNRLSQVVHATGGDTVTTYTHPAAGGPQPHTVVEAQTTGPGGGQLDSYTYDQAGNMTQRVLAGDAQSLDYDAEGNLVTVTDSTGEVSQFVYDADGNRLIRRDGDGSTLYLPGGQELRYDAATGQQTCTRYYQHIDTLVAVRTADELTWMVTDHHNTAEVAVRDSDLQAARRRTTAFGQPRGPQPAFWAGDKGFVGGTEDPTGLVHLGARMYDQKLGRFTSVDPIIDFDDPQQMHGYAYGNNSPPVITDPDGLFGLGDIVNKAKSAVTSVKRNAQRIRTAVASATRTAASATANFARQTINEIKEDPLKFATEVAVGAAVAAGAAALCAATVGVGCVVIAGAAAGAAAAGAAYEVDVLQGERQFSVGELATEMAIGGVIGGATAGIGVLGRRVGSRIVNKFRRSCNSFVPGTAVAMADGTHTPIEDVQLGDQVLATDPETGQSNPEQVVATITGDGHKKLVEITVEDTREPDAEPDAVTATDGHPIWVANRGPDGKWIDAADLKPGDLLLTPDGATVRVIAIVAYGALATVHNLTIANLHTFHVQVGKADALTHNDNSCWVHPGPGVEMQHPDLDLSDYCTHRGPWCPPAPGVQVTTAPGAAVQLADELVDLGAGDPTALGPAAFLVATVLFATGKSVASGMRSVVNGVRNLAQKATQTVKRRFGGPNIPV